MNGFSQTKLHRAAALLLFFILGPALLLAVLGLVLYRHSGSSRADEEARLTRLFRLRTEMSGTEFVRPGIRTYFGLTLFAGRAETPFLFCPEILARPLGANRLPPDQVSRFLREMRVEGSSLETDSAAETDAPAGREWLIPDLYLKLSQWRDAEPLLHGRAGGFPAGGILFRVGRVHLIPSDELFDQIAGEYTPPRRRFGTDIIDELAAIGGGKTKGEHGELSSSGEVSAYTQNKTESLIDEVLGVWLRAGGDSFVLTQFRLTGITASEPVTLALFGRSGAEPDPVSGNVIRVPEAVIPGAAEAETGEGAAPEPHAAAENGRPAPAGPNTEFPLRWHLDSSCSPFPAQVLAHFSPALAGWGERCWISGRMTSLPDTGGNPPRRRTLLKGVDFHDADLTLLLKKITSTRIEGELNRLAVKEGELSDGVFFGSGQVRLLRARFKKDFLTRFQKEFGLEFRPADILVNRFPDDMVPLDRVMFDFALKKEGVSLKAAETSRGIAAVSESTDPRYQMILPGSGEKTVSYPALLETLSDGSDNSFWSEFYRDALNHLPVPEEHAK